MSKRAKPAIIRFYVDADVLGLARILVQMRPDVTYPGDPGGVVKGRRVRPPYPITDPSTPQAGTLLHGSDRRRRAVRSSARALTLAGH